MIQEACCWEFYTKVKEKLCFKRKQYLKATKGRIYVDWHDKWVLSLKCETHTKCMKADRYVSLMDFSIYLSIYLCCHPHWLLVYCICLLVLLDQRDLIKIICLKSGDSQMTSNLHVSMCCPKSVTCSISSHQWYMVQSQ